MVITTHIVRSSPFRPAARPVRAFTLIELLVVIGIIVLLLGVAFTVGRSVTNSGRMRQTEQTLRVLDTALSEYVHSQETVPPAWVVDPRSANSPKSVIPVVDGRGRGGSSTEQLIDSVALFMLQCRGLPQIEAKFRDLDARLVREVALNVGNGVERLTTVVDGWGRPIRYVHPAFGGLLHPPGQPDQFMAMTSLITLPAGHQYAVPEIRRGSQDADGGLPQANRPYFYSAGPDGDPATVDDNVYMTKPRFTKN
jgi:prepilin-type N-terminal cleavage/methylation domain-containing protein